jgi:hypothetical protein
MAVAPPVPPAVALPALPAVAPTRATMCSASSAVRKLRHRNTLRPCEGVHVMSVVRRSARAWPRVGRLMRGPPRWLGAPVRDQRTRLGSHDSVCTHPAPLPLWMNVLSASNLRGVGVAWHRGTCCADGMAWGAAVQACAIHTRPRCRQWERWGTVGSRFSAPTNECLVVKGPHPACT